MDPGGPRGPVRDRRHNDPGEDDDGHEDHCLERLLQGREKRGHRSWVTHYHISYSEDAYRWEWARDIYGDKKVRVTMLEYQEISDGQSVVLG